jgi:hypothetical protein
VSYEVSWEDAVRELTRFGVEQAEKVVDFVHNFNRIVYWMADGRYHYDPPEQQTMLLPHVGGVEIDL